jgi:hypothetical protein
MNTFKSIAFTSLFMTAASTGSALAASIVWSSPSAQRISDRSMFVASGMYRLSDSSHYRAANWLNQATRAFQKNPDLSAPDAIRYLNDYIQAYDQVVEASRGKMPRSVSEAEQFGVQAGLTVASKYAGSPLAGMAAGLISDALPLAIDASMSLMDRAYQDSSRDRSGVAREARRRADQEGKGNSRTALVATYELYSARDEKGGIESAFSKVYDELFLGELGVRPTDSRAEILERNPALKADFEQNEKLKSLASRVESMKGGGAVTPDIETAVREYLVGLNQATRGAIDKAVHDEREERQMAEKERAVFQQRRQAEVAGIYVVSQMLEHLGGSEGMRIGRALSSGANAAIQLRGAIENFAARNALDGISATAILTGDVLSVGIGLVGALAGGPSTDQLILQQLSEIRDQIAQLEKGLHARLDHVDQTLSTLLTTMVQGMDQLQRSMDKGFEHTQNSVYGLYRALNDMQTRLMRQEKRIIDALVAMSERPVRERNAECREFKSNSPGAVMSYGMFKACLESYQQAGTEAALDPLASTPRSGAQLTLSFDEIDSQLKDRLEEFEMDSNLNLLAQLAEGSRTGVRASAKALANPVKWAEAADGYLRLISEWPDHRRIMGRSGVNGLLQIGEDLESFSTSLAGLSPADEKRGRPVLFGKLVAQLREANAWVRDLIWKRLSPAYGKHNFDGVNPALSAHQQGEELTVTMDDRMYEDCDGSKPLPAPPASVLNRQLPAVVKQAQLLGLGAVRTCYSFSWAGQHEASGRIDNGDFHYREYLPGSWVPIIGWKTQIGTPQMEVYFTFRPNAGSVPQLDHFGGRKRTIEGERNISTQIWELWSQGTVARMGIPQGANNGAIMAALLRGLEKPTSDRLWVGLSGRAETTNQHNWASAIWVSAWERYRIDYFKDAPRVASESPEFSTLASAVEREKKRSREMTLTDLQAAAWPRNGAEALSRKDRVSVEQAMELKAALNRVGLLKTVIDSYLTFGLPESFANQDELRALLRGQEAIVDDRMLAMPGAMTLSEAFGSTPDGRGLADLRVDALDKVLLTQVLPGAHEPQVPMLIRDTMRRLSTAAEMLRVEAPLENISDVVAELQARISSVQVQR